MPARMARVLLPGPRSEINVHTVITMIPRATMSTRMPIRSNTATSNEVSWLKCEGTPRQRCKSMSAVSGRKSETATAQGQASHPVRGRRAITAASERAVRPPEMPNSIGFRQLTGPSQPPSRSR